MAICPILSNLAFGVELHPKAEKLLCLTHGGLCLRDNDLCNLGSATCPLPFIVNPRHKGKVSIPAMPKSSLDKMLLG